MTAIGENNNGDHKQNPCCVRPWRGEPGSSCRGWEIRYVCGVIVASGGKSCLRVGGKGRKVWAE